MSRQKNKGNSFERAVASDLSNIFELPFNRTMGSGSFIGGKNQYRKSQISTHLVTASRGDIVCPAEHGWNFIIECKNYADLNFNGIIQGYCDKLSGWITEVRFDAENKSNHMVCFKINRAGTYLALPFIKEKADYLMSVEVPYTLYPYYAYDEELEANTLEQWYCIISYEYLAGDFNESDPSLQQAVKLYIEHLATKLSI